MPSKKVAKIAIGVCLLFGVASVVWFRDTGDIPSFSMQITAALVVIAILVFYLRTSAD